MEPVRHAGCNFVYRGPTADIGDLHCHVRGNTTEVVYELDDADRERIANGGRVMLGILGHPIPPLSMQVIDEGMCRPIGEHGWKDIPELADPERQ